MPSTEKFSGALETFAHAFSFLKGGTNAINYKSYDSDIAIYGDRWNFSMLGHEYEGFKTQYAKCYAALIEETSGWIEGVRSGLSKTVLMN